MIKGLLKNPYTVTSLVFLLVILFGWGFLGWRTGILGFVLLLYFIVTLGIRMDDIAKQIGSGHGRPSQVPDGEKTVINQLAEINQRLAAIDGRLKAMGGDKDPDQSR